jgi:predicted cobalt transporter CbtA
MTVWRSTIRASLLAGLAAGGVAAVFTYVVLEPSIKVALAIEDARGVAQHEAGMPHAHEAVLVTRGWQQVGGAVAVIVTALLLALVYSVLLTRFRLSWKVGELPSALLVAAGCFTVFSLVPALKYPANPPAVGDPSTINERTTLYFAVVVLSVLTATALLLVAGYARRGGWSSVRIAWTTAAVVATGAVLIIVGLPPGPGTIPADVPAALAWQFRVQSLGMLALLWATIGLVSGTLLARQASLANASPAAQRVVLTGW